MTWWPSIWLITCCENEYLLPARRNLLQVLQAHRASRLHHFYTSSYPNGPLEQRLVYLFCTVSWVCRGGCACSPSLRQQSYLNSLYAQAQRDMRCCLLDLIRFPDRQNQFYKGDYMILRLLIVLISKSLDNWIINGFGRQRKLSSDNLFFPIRSTTMCCKHKLT